MRTHKEELHRKNIKIPEQSIVQHRQRAKIRVSD